jgi:restriction system protein
MAIPEYKKIMLPLLKYTGDNKVHSRSETIQEMAAYFKLSNDEIQEKYPNRNQIIHRSPNG